MEQAPAAELTAVKNTLPRNIEVFTGRTEEFDHLIQAISAGKLPGGLVAIDGMPGVNTRDFRCLGLSGAYRLLCSLSVLESVCVAALLVCGHGLGPRVAAGLAHRSHGPRPRRPGAVAPS